MGRGNNRMPVFEADVAKRFFLRALDEAFTKFKTTLHAYCLMTNHFHLLVQVAESALGNAMHLLQSRFARRYNLLTGKEGHVFGRRYQAILCDNDNYLLTVLRYIHRNPVAAGIVRTVDDWTWSSHSAYLGMPRPFDPKVETSLCLSLFGSGRPAIEGYRAFMDADAPAPWPHEEPEWTDSMQLDQEVPTLESAPAIPERLFQYLEEFVAEVGVDLAELLGPSRDRYLSQLRYEFARRAVACGFSIADAARLFGRAKSGFTRAIREAEA